MPAPGKAGYAKVVTHDDEEAEALLPSGLPYGGWNEATLLSKWTYSWVTPIVKRGSQQQLSVDDVPPIPAPLRVDGLVELMKRNCEAKGIFEPGDNKKTLLRTVFVPMFFDEYFKAWFFNVVQQSCELSTPIVLRLFIQWHGSGRPVYIGVLYSFLMFALTVIASWSMANGGVKNYVSGLKMRASMMALIYEKSTRSTSTGETVGQIVNYMSSDSQRFPEACMMTNHMLMTPCWLLLAMAQLVSLMGVSGVLGTVIMILGLVSNKKLWKRLKKLRTKQMMNTDSRLMLVNEALTGIRVLKQNCWEDATVAKITEMRDIELGRLKAQERIVALIRFSFFSMPVLVAVVTFGTHALLGDPLDAGEVFSALALFTLIQNYLRMMPRAMATYNQLFISQKRIKTYLQRPERQIADGERTVQAAMDGFGEIILTNATFTHSQDNAVAPATPAATSSTTAAAVLRDISLHAARGDLVAVVGPVGCGKSSLLLAILGELRRTSGSQAVRGSVAYCAQQAWILAGTLRDNVTFGREYNEARFELAIECSGLRPDLAQLPAGEFTEIGERGINISGGQKQRISLARAVYRDADIYILDDILSAVDVHVGQHLLEHCICGALRHKTRVFATNQLHTLPDADHVVVLGEGGIIEQGTYNQLIAANGWLSSMVDKHSSGSKEADSGAPPSPLAKDAGGGLSKGSVGGGGSGAVPGGTAGAKLVKTEVRQSGAVTLKTYAAWFTAGGSKQLIVTMLFGGFLLPELCNSFSQFWLAAWSNDSGAETLQYLSVYAFVALGSMCLVLGRAFIWAGVAVNAAGTLHRRMLVNIMRQPVSFFDTTPLGRILTRFAHDIDQIDSAISQTMQESFEFVARGTFSICIIVVIMPALALPFAVTLLVYRSIANYYRKSSREMKRIDSTTKSPIFADFSQSLNGLVTIRAYGDEEMFCAKNRELIQRNTKVMFMNLSLGRWLAMRVDVLGALIIFFVTLSCCVWRDSVSGGVIGLMLVNALGCIRVFRMGVKMGVDVEAQMTYVERVCEFAQLPPEPASLVAGDPPEPWPPSGGIAFEHAELRYREGLPLALKDASFVIKPGTKVGICGRTGAGKSTLTSALFRLVELSSGEASFDGTNISVLGLRTVRRSLAIIPQDPVIFTGTFRENLDPFREVSDGRILETVELVQLGRWLREQAEGLEAPIEEGGANLSVGQRQLICLARALLRQPKILILDEATASVDYETDRLIQQTIRTEFKGTVVTIAHRLNTIMDADQILVLGEGRIIEAGQPADLLRKPGDHPLRSMVDELGAAAHAHFLAIADGELSVIDTLQAPDEGEGGNAGGLGGESPVIVDARSVPPP